MKNIFGIFLILHGVVYLLYLGHAMRYFELQPGLTWPDGSWAFSKLLGNETTRWLASVLCGLAAIGFVAAGTAVLLSLDWWRTLVIGMAVISVIAFSLLWNGKMQKLDAQGGIGLLINIALLVAVVILHWPDIDS